MKYAEFKELLSKAGITINEFASLLKLNPISITNYNKQPQVPKHMVVIATLIADMAKNGLDFKATLSKIDIEAHAPRTNTFGGKKE